MRVFAPLLAFLLALLLSSPARAAAPVPHRVSADLRQIDITSRVGFLEDATATLTPAEVAKLADSGAVPAVTNPRIKMMRIDRGEAYWLKADVIADASAPRDWLLELGRPNVDRVQLFEREPGGGWRAYPEVGAARPFSARVTDHRSFVYPVRLAPGEVTSFLVRIVYAGPSAPRITLWQPAALAARDRGVLVFGGLYFGLTAGLLLYNLLLFLAVKDRAYLYYTGFIAFLATAHAGSSGLGAQFAWGEAGWWMSRLMYVSYAATLMFSALLTRRFANTRERMPRIDRVLRVLAWAFGAAAVNAALQPSNLAVMPQLPFGVVSALIIPWVGYVGFRRKWAGARFFFAAWVVLYAAELAVIGRTFGLVPYTLLVENAVPLASAIDMILLSLALADRINEERRQKAEAQTLSLGVFQAAQALATETRLDRLHKRLCDIVASLTGATAVRLLVPDAVDGGWTLQVAADGAGEPIALEDAIRRGLLPAETFRLVEDARHAVVAEDSWLVQPVLHHGTLRAILMVEHRELRGDLPPQARTAIESIAGTLAVSLENVQLYEGLEQRVAQRTAELRATQAELVHAARRAGMAEVATNVLHNVGNTLNSVNVSAELLRSRIAAGRAASLGRAVDLIEANAGRLGTFFDEDERGRMLPRYLRELSDVLQRERDELQEQLGHLIASVDHIKRVVATQQAYAGASLISEDVTPGMLVEDALRIAGGAAVAADVQIVRELADIPPVRLDKTRALQILVNLVDNARQAMAAEPADARKLTLQVDADAERLRFRVRDSGCGIAPENLTRVFSHGFSTRAGGHGFGLHSCALAAGEMGGSLKAESEGPGRGATFTLELPLQPA